MVERSFCDIYLWKYLFTYHIDMMLNSNFVNKILILIGKYTYIHENILQIVIQVLYIEYVINILNYY